MRRLLVVFTLISMVATLGFAQPVGATLWCKEDPVVRLNGTIVDITIAIALAYVPLVNGPVEYEVQTPNGSRLQIIFVDSVVFGNVTVIRFSDEAVTVK